jgi:ABC-type nitrate/sulfonate/bicarbonate transport system ATPase subunit
MEQPANIKATHKLYCKGVGKTFTTKKDSFEVIRDISLEVKENEFLVLFGPGQCGKTTLLNMFTGQEETTTGEIYHNEEKVTKPHWTRGMVYQTTALFPWLTVEGNVGYGPKTRGIPAKERDERVAHFIDLVGLTGFEKSYPIQLSGGMKQRVGIARAYCNDPDILFMDEPFGHLDAQTRYMMQEALEKIWQNDKRTIIFVTNNIEEAIFLADRIILLSDCPSQIQAEYKIDLPRPRNIVDPEFLKLRKEITKKMDEGIFNGGM